MTERVLGVAFVPSLAVLVFSTIPLIPFFGLRNLSLAMGERGGSTP